MTSLDIQFQERCAFLSPSHRMWVLLTEVSTGPLMPDRVSKDKNGVSGKVTGLGSEWEEVEDLQGAYQDSSS